MEFEIFIKQGENRYEKRSFMPEVNDNGIFFRNLLSVIDKELDNIKRNIEDIGGTEVNIRNPKHKSVDIQEKLNKLIDMRKVNSQTKELINELLREPEFIICSCGAKMHKTPVNISYQKYGNSYIISTPIPTQVEYVFMCEKCIRAINEESYNFMHKNRMLRKKLLNEGYTFIPNEFGFWHWLKCNGKCKAPPEFVEKKVECDHAYDRLFERDTGSATIKDVCRKCNKINIVKKFNDNS